MTLNGRSGQVGWKTAQADQEIDGGQNRVSFSIVIGQAPLCQQPEPLALPFEKCLDTQALARPLAGLIDLTIPLQLFRLRLKNGQPDIVWLWTDHSPTSLYRPLRNRPLRFDQYERPLPDLHAQQLYSAQHRNLIWHDTSSFASWIIRHGYNWNLPCQGGTTTLLRDSPLQPGGTGASPKILV